MDKVELQRLIAKNLATAYGRKFGGEVNQSELARQSHISQKTISNILSAIEKSSKEVEELPSTTITNLARLAQTLDTPIWALLHPDPQRAARIDEMLKNIELDYRKETAGQPEKDEFGGQVLGGNDAAHERTRKQK